MGIPLKALIVEDSEDDALLLLLQLRNGDYDIYHKRVETKKEMIAALQNESWDIVFSDYNMPGFDGDSALQVLKSFKIDIPFIVISGAIGEDIAVKMMRNGAHDYFMKGNLVLLVSAVKRELSDAEVRQRNIEIEAYQKLTTVILDSLNRLRDHTNRSNSNSILTIIKDFFDVEAIAVRLVDGNNLLINKAIGYSTEFLQYEQNVCLNIDAEYSGNTCLKEKQSGCTYICHSIINNDIDPSKNYYTDGGSFWTNDVTKIKSENGTPICFICNSNLTKYKSIAVIPLYSENRIIGILQLNDTRKDRFTREKINFLERISLSIGIGLARVQATKEIKELAKFPNENPNPVMRILSNGNISYANPSSSYILNELNLKTGDTIDPEIMQWVNESLNTAHIQQMEYLCKDKYYFMTYTPLEGYVNIYALDITLKKEKEKEKIIFKEKLIKTEKLAAVGQLAAGIAHEFNNVLTIIKSASQLMIMEKTQGIINIPESVVKELNLIDKQTNRGSKIVKDLMSLSNPKESDYGDCVIEEILEDVLNFQKKQLTLENITVESNFSVKNILTIDRGQIQQVFLNLIINARHAMKENHKGILSLVTKVRDKSLDIIISDTGVGMSEDVIQKIFTPFFTTKGAYANDSLDIKGTGLGLSVSYSIIENHYGFITVDSTVGKGTTFTITLPLPGEDKQVSSDVINYSNNISSLPKHLNVLIVDDEKEITELYTRTLKDLNISVTTSTSGVEALNILDLKNIDAVILDYMMPEMNGMDIYDKMQKNHSNVKILFISGTSNIINVKNKSNILGVLQKPVDFDEIIKCLQKV